MARLIRLVSGGAVESVPRAHYDTDKTITRGMFSNAVGSHQTGVLFSADHLCIWLGVRSRVFQFKHLSCILYMGPVTGPRREREREGWEGVGYQPMLSPPRLREHPGITNKCISSLWVYNSPDDAP